MNHLYAPWRNKYVKGDVRGKTEDTLKEECAFCQKINEDNDKKHFILGRFNHFAIMLFCFHNKSCDCPTLAGTGRPKYCTMAAE